jgi:hypothetical protein
MKNNFFHLFLIFSLITIINTSCIKEELPEVETYMASDIRGTSVTLIGLLHSEVKQGQIKSKGFVWSEHKNPTMDDHRVISAGVKEFNETRYFLSVLPELKPNTQFYFRAFVVNDDGVGLGQVKSFTTNADSTSFITLQRVIPVAAYSAMVQGYVSQYADDYLIREKGLCWAKNRYPSIADDHVTLKDVAVNHLLQGLEEETKYFVALYAVLNNGDIIYSEAKSLQTRKLQGSITRLTYRSAVSVNEFKFPLDEYSFRTGVQWSESPTPGAEDEKILEGKNILLDNLKPNTTYYMWPFIDFREAVFDTDFTREFSPVIIFATPPLAMGDGTYENPYSVTDILYLMESEQPVWVRGYIAGQSGWCGYIPNSDPINCLLTSKAPFEESGSFVIAATRDEVFYGNALSVNYYMGPLPDELQLHFKPHLMGKEVLIKGTFTKFWKQLNFSEFQFIN